MRGQRRTRADIGRKMTGAVDPLTPTDAAAHVAQRRSAPVAASQWRMQIEMFGRACEELAGSTSADLTGVHGCVVARGSLQGCVPVRS
jgi:hypothetical protein